jgi:hypothetical protein
MLAPDTRSRLINKMFSGSLNGVRRKHWENVRHIPDYAFGKSWHFRTASVLAVLTWLLAVFGALSAALGWHRWGLALWDWDALVVLVAAALMSFDETAVDVSYLETFLAWICLSPLTALQMDYRLLKQPLRAWGIVRVFASVSLFMTTPCVLLYAFAALEFLGRAAAVGIVASVAAIVGVLLFVGGRKGRAARNPLHGLLPS